MKALETNIEHKVVDAKLNVMIIEDSRQDAFLITRKLKQSGYVVTTKVIDTQDAMQKALKEQQWDIIVCDYNMPHFSAPVALRILKESKIDIPFILVSGIIDENTAFDMVRSGAHDYIGKDNLSRLAPAIERELREAINRQKRRQIELALRNSEEKYRKLVETAGDAIIVADAQTGILIDANQKAQEMLGMDKEKIIGMHQTQLHPKKEAKHYNDVFNDAVNRGNDVINEVYLQHKDGHRIPVEIRSSVTVVGGRKIIQGIFRDISIRKQVEQEHYINELRLEAMVTLNQMSNASIDDISDYTLKESIKLTMSKIGFCGLISEDEKILYTYSWSQSVMKECTTPEKPLHFIVEEGGIWAEAIRQRKAIIVNDYTAPNIYKKGYPKGHVELRRVMVVPVFSYNKIAAVVAVGNKDKEYNHTDLRQLELLANGMWQQVERKRYIEQLNELNRILEDKVKEETEKKIEKERLLIQQSKLAAMGEMIGAIAHQWRQPLNAVSAFLIDLKDAYKHGQLCEEYLNNNIDNVRQQLMFMSKTIDDFRNFFKPSKEKALFDTKEVIKEVIKLIEYQFKNNNITFQLNLQDNKSLTICGYPNEFKQALINIINNAKDAILEKGKALETENYQGIIKISTYSDGNKNKVVIHIQDNGGGIHADIIERVFEPYFTTKEQWRGVGIGLYMSKTIIEKNMAGQLSVKNIDDGAEFTIEI